MHARHSRGRKLEPNSTDKNNFLYPRSKYHGEFNLENLIFNANLQEFAMKVSYIASLETSGKISPQQAYKQIKVLYKKLRCSVQELEINNNLSLQMQGKKGLRQRELCEKLGLDYKQVAQTAIKQGVSTHEYVQKITGWILRNELYYPPNT